jgi:UDP-N-acetylglucosamine diphosphorylase/glucosamine-1-phosphate N-acetyltransferase
MNIGLKDSLVTWENLLPLTFNKSVADMRIGILTIAEKWSKYLNTSVSIQYVNAYLGDTTSRAEITIDSSVLPTEVIVDAILALKENEVLAQNGFEIASNAPQSNPKTIEFLGDLSRIEFPWDIFTKNDAELRKDFDLLIKGKISQPIDATNKVIGNQLFIEEGAKIQCAILNTETGPIYIDKNAEIMEGSIIRGPFYLGEHATLKLGTKIYGATTIGKECKVGGEVSNSVIFGYSNKAHDGFIGNTVIGEWCNLGADTNCSNLKNNYSLVDIYNYRQEKMMSTGQQFCGLIMGDYSKTGINTMLNTGTVVGICSNIFGAGFPSKHIPSFSWCSIDNTEIYQLEKGIETIERMKARRGLKLEEREKQILKFLFDQIGELKMY